MYTERIMLLGKFIQSFKRNWGFFILFLIVLSIAFTNFHADSTDLIGWDNFSVHLNLPVNFFRTLFSSWRSYRGLGVIGDSEITDVFRQIILYLLKIFIPNNKITEVYYFILLMCGTLGTYFLQKEVVSQYSNKNTLIEELSAVFAGMLYISSFYTIGTFFLPITMYVVRFAFFPVIIWSFLRLISRKKVFAKKEIFIFSVLLGSVAYLTATVFFTLLIPVIFIFFQNFFFSKKNKKRVVLVLLLFFALNAFWLFSFLNYTFQKSSILSQASTFVEVNEIQLNKPSTTFSWKNLFLMIPSFFDTKYQDISSGEDKFLHPLAGDFIDSEQLVVYFWVLLSLTATGSLYILLRLKDRKTASFWLLPLLLISLFFLRKGYTPFGFIYEWLDVNIPFMRIVLRFGGEKFYPLLVIALVALSGFSFLGILQICEFVKFRKKPVLLYLTGFGALFAIVFWSSHLFNTLWRSQFYSDVVKTQIPDQYYQIASIINDEKQDDRVLHLPMDRKSYWKSYEWGYVGSSFFNFLIKKPLIDRTFEPASPENDYLDQKVMSLITNASYLDQPSLQDRAKQMKNLLDKSGIHNVIVDQSVNKSVVAKNGVYFGEFDMQDTITLFNEMEKEGLLKKSYEGEISLNKIISDPVGNSGITNPKITLLENDDSRAMVESITNSKNIDPSISNIFNLVKDENIIQDASQPSRTYPFFQPNQHVTFSENGAQISQPIQSFSDEYRSGFDQVPNNQHAVSVFATLEDQGIRIYLQPITSLLNTPDLFHPETARDFFLPFEDGNNEAVNDQYMRSNYRLQVAQQVLNLSALEANQLIFIDSVLVENNTIQLSLLSKSKEVKVPPSAINYTEQKNCFKDSGKNFGTNLVNSKDELLLSTRDGRSCLTFGITEEPIEDAAHLEISLNIQASEKVGDQNSQQQHFESLNEALLDNYIKSLDNAHYFTACIFDPVSGECVNSQQVFSTNTAKSNTFVSDTSFQADNAQVLLTFPTNGEETVSTAIQNVKADIFVHSGEDVVVSLPTSYLGVTDFQKNANDDSFTWYLPFLLSTSSKSYSQNKGELFEAYHGQCQTDGGDRQLKSINGRMISYVNNCLGGFYSRIPFSSNNLYISLLQYAIYSGKSPRFFIQGVGKYKNDYLFPLSSSIGGRPLQQADKPSWLEQDFSLNISKVLDSPDYHTSMQPLLPQGNVQGDSSILFQVIQDSENQGIFEINQSSILQLPSYWQSFYVENGDIYRSYHAFSVKEITSILPSLWKVTIVPQENDSESEILLDFGQAYDAQWNIFKTDQWWQAFFNIGKLDVPHVKVNGWSNGWRIPSNYYVENESVTFYMFFIPERLALIGWIVTVLSIPSMYVLLRSRPRKDR